METYVDLQEFLDLLADYLHTSGVVPPTQTCTSSPAMDTLSTALTHQHTHMLSLSSCALTIPEAALSLACCLQRPDSQLLAPLVSEPDMAAWPVAAPGSGLLVRVQRLRTRDQQCCSGAAPGEAGLCSNILAENGSPFRR